MKHDPEHSTDIICWRGGVPVIAARRVGSALTFYCEHCGEQHVHRRGNEHHVARCTSPTSPFGPTGYFLVAGFHDLPPEAA